MDVKWILNLNFYNRKWKWKWKWEYTTFDPKLGNYWMVKSSNPDQILYCLFELIFFFKLNSFFYDLSEKILNLRQKIKLEIDIQSQKSPQSNF
jgi:hypothetical protein